MNSAVTGQGSVFVWVRDTVQGCVLCRAVFCAGHRSHVVYEDSVRGVSGLYLVRVSVFQCASSANLMGLSNSLVHLCLFWCLFCATVSCMCIYRHWLAFFTSDQPVVFGF